MPSWPWRGRHFELAAMTSCSTTVWVSWVIDLPTTGPANTSYAAVPTGAIGGATLGLTPCGPGAPATWKMAAVPRDKLVKITVLGNLKAQSSCLLPVEMLCMTSLPCILYSSWYVLAVFVVCLALCDDISRGFTRHTKRKPICSMWLYLWPLRATCGRNGTIFYSDNRMVETIQF